LAVSGISSTSATERPHALRSFTQCKLVGWLKHNRLAAIFVFGLFLIWEIAVRKFAVPVYILPAPSEVLRIIVEKRTMFATESVPTLIETVAGFAIGNGFAILLAVVLIYLPAVEGAVMSLAITLRSIPLVALAPLLVLLLGDGYMPRVVVVAIICFFPTLVNMHLGLTGVDLSASELFDSLSATALQRLFKLQFPSALPALFAALKVAASSAVLGAIIAEWVNSNQGLGFVVIQSTYQSQARELYGAIFICSLMSIAFYMLVAVIEKSVVTWHARLDAL
jgi:NitT/TauT family transport system permease protein